MFLKYSIQIILLTILLLPVSKGLGQQAKIKIVDSSACALFPKGEKISNANFTGTVYLKMLVEADSLNATAIGSVTFEPAARTKWHYHPAGQILMALEGVGYYQEKGQSKKLLRKGDVVKCPPNVPHWHGASADSNFVQVAVTNNSNGPTVWMSAVTEDEYNQ